MMRSFCIVLLGCIAIHVSNSGMEALRAGATDLAWFGQFIAVLNAAAMAVVWRLPQ